MKLTRLLAVLALTLFLVACGAPTIDASSEEAFKTSVEEMTKDMSDEEKKEFGQAIMKLSMKTAMSSITNPDEVEAKMKEMFDGKTAKEIITMSKE